MHVTIVNGEVIDLREPWYVHIGRNAGWQKADRENALALSVDGNLYKLDGKRYEEDLPNGNWVYVEPGNLESGICAAFVTEVPDGTYTMRIMNTANGHTVDIADLNEGVMELAGAQAVSADELGAALMESADASAVAANDLETAVMEQADMIADLTARIVALEGALQSWERFMRRLSEKGQGCSALCRTSGMRRLWRH